MGPIKCIIFRVIEANELTAVIVADGFNVVFWRCSGELMRVSGLAPGATYAFSLSAGNAVGYGPAVKFRVTTLPDQPPSKQPHTDNGDISLRYVSFLCFYIFSI